MTDISSKSLIDRIEETLAYFCDEFPKDKYPEVWSGHVSPHSGGITPDDLQSVLTMLYAAPKPEVKRGEIRDTADKLYDQLRYELIRWANINPDDMEKYTAYSAFSYIHKNSWRPAAERFIHDALHLVELYRAKAPVPVSVSLERCADAVFNGTINQFTCKDVAKAVLESAGVKYE